MLDPPRAGSGSSLGIRTIGGGLASPDSSSGRSTSEELRMAKYLFPDFLRDLQPYEQAEFVWKRSWQDLIQHTGQLDLWKTPWFRTTFADGTPSRDGNPIVAAISPT